MKVVLQRVKKASVSIDGKVISQIEKGILVLLGVESGDTSETVKKYVAKIKKLRIFDDNEGKTNFSIDDVSGELLVVSQFTLLADCKKGNRPSFANAAPPDVANELYEEFIKEAKTLFKNVGCGVFGADMLVSIENDGPFTLVIDNL